MHELLLYFAFLFLFLCLSIFFSGSETAFMALDRLRLKYRAQSGDKKAESIHQVVSNPERLLSVILLGNTITNIGAATLVTYMVTTHVPQDTMEMASLLGSAMLTLVILIFCEMAPKIMAATHPEKLTAKLIWPIRFSILVLGPFARLGSWCANWLVRLAGMPASASPFTHALSEEEIRAIISGSAGHGLGEEKREMLHKVFEIGATQVREVMIPRTEVSAAEIEDSIDKIFSLMRRTNYSRIPVYRQSFDNMVGILYVKDLLPYIQRPEEIRLEFLLRPVHFVPDTARLETVLRQFQSMHLHMAIVVDEFGGVEGIVTLEDLLEEIVGEIRDEHDTEGDMVREVGPNIHAFAGNLPVREFNRTFQTKIPESREYTTVVGFLEARTGRLLLEGERIRYQDLTFSIEKVEGFKILSIRVRVLGAREAAEIPSPAKTG